MTETITPTAKAIGLRKSLDLMRKPGTRLVQTKSANGPAFYIVPGGYVDRATAAKIINHPQVRAGRDGMWPGMDQTWRMESVK